MSVHPLPMTVHYNQTRTLRTSVSRDCLNGLPRLRGITLLAPAAAIQRPVMLSSGLAATIAVRPEILDTVDTSEIEPVIATLLDYAQRQEAEAASTRTAMLADRQINVAIAAIVESLLVKELEETY